MVSKMNEIESETKEKSTSKEQDYLDTMNREFKWAFLQKPDLRASYAIGLLYNRISSQQRKIMKTRGLEKQMRYLLDPLNKTNLLKIFVACSKVAFDVQSKTREETLSYNSIRSKAEELLAHFSGEATEEELSVAFMFGYDSVKRTWNNLP